MPIEYDSRYMHATNLRHRKLGNLDSARATQPDQKKQYVSRMFDVIAPRYVLFTRLFSYGMDSRWKREMLDSAAGHEYTRIADIACGTGDFLDAILQKRPLELAIGIDIAAQMARRAYSRAHARGGYA